MAEEFVAPTLQRQRRGKLIAMTDEERDVFLAAERTCRVATVGKDGAPHVSPLWFSWHGGALRLFSIIRSQRWADLVRDPRVSAVVDAGVYYPDSRPAWLRIAVEKVASWDFRKFAAVDKDRA